MTYLLFLLILIFDIDTDQKRILQWLGPQGAALPENDASAELTTANGRTFTSSSATLSSQSHYSTLDQ